MAQKRRDPEEKLEIVLAVLRGQESMAEICRRHGVSETALYKWRTLFLEGGRSALANGKEKLGTREAQLERENEELKKTVGELTMQTRLLKKLQ